MKENDIIYENGQYWVCRNKSNYTVFRTGLTHSESDSAYTLSEDGLSCAKARCDYLQRVRGNKP